MSQISLNQIRLPFCARFFAIWILGYSCVSTLMASNPWGRALGEADCLQDVTEDLRNRTHRLFSLAPSTALTCILDESAQRLREMVKCGADWRQLQFELQKFEEIKILLARTASEDCHVSRDRAIQNYLRSIDDRFGDLVRDLSKCKPPMPSCHSPYPTHPHSLWLTPNPSFYEGQYPSMPNADSQEDQRLIPYESERLPSYVPKNWQGSNPSNSNEPHSTYAYETLRPNYPNEPNRNAFSLQKSERPLASEILNLILSRAMK